MAFLTSGRNRQCKSTLGSIKAAYLAPYKKVLRSEIVYDGVSLLEFPETLIYKFELVSGDFTQNQQDSEGGKFFTIDISLVFNKITAFDNMQFQRMLKKDYFIIIEDNNGNFFLLGFRNGLSANSLKTSTTQYTIDFSGQEEEIAPFVNELINEDLIIFEEGEDYIFQDDTNYIFEDDTNYIFQ